MIGSFLTASNAVIHHILVRNLCDTTRTLHDGAWPGIYVFPVESLKKVQAMLWVEDSERYDSDSDEEELLNMLTTSIVDNGVQGKSSNANTRMDVCMILKTYQSTCSHWWSG